MDHTVERGMDWLRLGCLLEGFFASQVLNMSSSTLSTAPYSAEEGRSQVMLDAFGDFTKMG